MVVSTVIWAFPVTLSLNYRLRDHSSGAFLRKNHFRSRSLTGAKSSWEWPFKSYGCLSIGLLGGNLNPSLPVSAIIQKQLPGQRLKSFHIKPNEVSLGYVENGPCHQFHHVTTIHRPHYEETDIVSILW